MGRRKERKRKERREEARSSDMIELPLQHTKTLLGEVVAYIDSHLPLNRTSFGRLISYWHVR